MPVVSPSPGSSLANAGQSLRLTAKDRFSTFRRLWLATQARCRVARGGVVAERDAPRVGVGCALGRERAWAIEECRQVSGRVERFLVARWEMVSRVAPKLMAGARRSALERGRSDVMDATAVARAAIRKGVERLPAYTEPRRPPLAIACPLNTAPPRSAPPSGILTAGVRMRALCSHGLAQPP